MALTFVALLLRDSPLFPDVFWDEWRYSRASRLTSLGNAATPNHLYYLIFRSTNYCGHAFLSCARTLNALFYVAALPFIYATAVRYMSSNRAFVIAAISAIAPYNVYTAYFMPESLYFLGFWIFTWKLLEDESVPSVGRVCLLGLILASLSLIKPHAFLLAVPAILVLAAAPLGPRSRRDHLRSTIGWAAIFCLSFLAFRMIEGWSITGRFGLDITGKFYGQHALMAGTNAGDAPLKFLSNVLVNFSLHVVSAATLFAFGMQCLLHGPSAVRNSKSGNAQSLRTLYVCVTSTFAILFLATAAFTAGISTHDWHESPLRIHARYYNFAFPLMFILAAAQTDEENKPGREPHVGDLVRFALVAGLIVIAWPQVRNLIEIELHTAPELTGLKANRFLEALCVGLGLFVAVSAAWSRRWASQAFAYVFLPVVTIAGSMGAYSNLMVTKKRTIYDEAGLFAQNVLSYEERGSLLVITNSDPRETVHGGRVVFHVDHPTADTMGFDSLEKMQSHDRVRISEWLLVVGKGPKPTNHISIAEFPDFSLWKSRDRMTINLAAKPWPQIVERISRPAASMTDGREQRPPGISVQLTNPLPRRFDLFLELDAQPSHPGTLAVTCGPITVVARTGDGKLVGPLHFDLAQGDIRDLSIEEVRSDSQTAGKPGPPGGSAALRSIATLRVRSSE